MKKNFSLFNLPKKVQFCKKCTMSNQKPNTVVEFKNHNNKKKGPVFKKGICSGCEYSQLKNKINWELREKELLKILDKYRGKGNYDCIVPGSGGKDSGYVAHILKYKYNMNPLSVTWAPHLFTEIGFKNFCNWMHVGGFDNVLFTPNGRLHRHLTGLAFKNLLHPFQPFIIGQKNIGPRIASKFDIPLIIYGENTAEYGASIKDNLNPFMPEEFYSSNKKDRDIYFGGKNIKKILKDTNYKINDFEPYMPLELNEVKKKRIKVLHMGYFHKWDPQEMFYYASENTGFRANSERTEGSYSKYSSIDDKLDTFHYYTTFIKFGIGRTTYDTAQEIRNEKITRIEGQSLVKKYDSEFPKKYYQEFLDYVNINSQEFEDKVNEFRSPHLWKKTKSVWKLKSTCFSD